MSAPVAPSTGSEPSAAGPAYREFAAQGKKALDQGVSRHGGVAYQTRQIGVER